MKDEKNASKYFCEPHIIPNYPLKILILLMDSYCRKSNINICQN